ncbi:MAG: hypothetical protein Q9223_002931, partial [Gallowayella weberi]
NIIPGAISLWGVPGGFFVEALQWDGEDVVAEVFAHADEDGAGAYESIDEIGKVAFGIVIEKKEEEEEKGREV